MELVRDLAVYAIRSKNISTAPFELMLKPHDTKLVLDAETMERHGIPLSFALIGCSITCTFMSGLLPTHQPFGGNNSYVHWSALQPEDLLMSLEKQETVEVVYDTDPARKREQVRRILSLNTWDDADHHPSPLTCPRYQFEIELTEEEYEACKQLPVLTYFRVSFLVK